MMYEDDVPTCRPCTDSFIAHDSRLVLSLVFQAINIYNEAGRFQQAGKMLKEVGEIHEKNREFPAAVDALQQAAEFLQVNYCCGKSVFTTLKGTSVQFILVRDM